MAKSYLNSRHTKNKKVKASLLKYNDKKYPHNHNTSITDSKKNTVHTPTTSLDSKTIHSQNDPLNPIAKVAIMGRPNVGKSSLFNRLHQQNIAITSPVSGSTRDINKKDLRLHHFDISLIDTGGLEVLAHTFDFSKTSEKSIQSFDKHSTSMLYSKKNTLQSIPYHINDINLHNKNMINPTQQTQIAQCLKHIISYHSYHIVIQSDIIIYVVDGSSVVIDEDVKIFRTLSKYKPTILVLNKIDSDKIALNESEFMVFGVDFVSISVIHNRGITKLLTHLENTITLLLQQKKLNPQPHTYNRNIITQLESTQDSIESLSYKDSMIDKTQNDEYEDISPRYHIMVGIIGRPNVGKSSLLNALTRQNRSLVSPIAGTTIDPVDESIIHDEHTITFVDTAGIRKRSRIEGIEKYALDRTQKILKQCNIAILVLDSSTEFVELDEKISSIAHNNELAIIVVLNKWDIRNAEFKERMEIYRHKFKFLEYAPVLTISSTTYHHIHKLKQKIVEIYENFSFRIPTSQLNVCIQNATHKHPIPSDHGKIVKIYYATQFDSKPPKIALIMNRPNALHFSYKRYLINTLRQEFNFEGTPIFIESRSKKNHTQEESYHNN